MSQKRTTGQSKPSEYKPTDREAASIRRALKERTEQAPGLKISKQRNVFNFGLDHPDNAIGHVLLMEALGTTDLDFHLGFLRQLGSVPIVVLNFQLKLPLPDIALRLAANTLARLLIHATFAFKFRQSASANSSIFRRLRSAKLAGNLGWRRVRS